MLACAFTCLAFAYQCLNLILKNAYVRKLYQSVSCNTRDQFDAVTVLMQLKLFLFSFTKNFFHTEAGL